VNYGSLSSPITVLSAQVTDLPTGLADVPSITLANQIGLTWVTPVFIGGSPLIDYRVLYDNAVVDGPQLVLVSGLTSTSYTATGLTQGSVYTF